MFWSYRKSRLLGRISRRQLQVEAQFEDGSYQPGRRDKTWDDVSKILKRDPYLSVVMDGWKVGPADVKELYKRLLGAGAGQVVNGHYVAASTLAFAPTLDYILEGVAEDRSWREMAYRMITYFEQGEMGKPT